MIKELSELCVSILVHGAGRNEQFLVHFLTNEIEREFSSTD